MSHYDETAQKKTRKCFSFILLCCSHHGRLNPASWRWQTHLVLINGNATKMTACTSINRQLSWDIINTESLIKCWLQNSVESWFSLWYDKKQQNKVHHNYKKSEVMPLCSIKRPKSKETQMAVKRNESKAAIFWFELCNQSFFKLFFCESHSHTVFILSVALEISQVQGW